jgi:hypothetical protein
MKADGKQTPILVVEDVQTLFDADAVDGKVAKLRMSKIVGF